MQLYEIIETAINAKASDIHLTVGIPPVVRVNGRLLHMGNENLRAEDTEMFTREILGERRYDEFQETGDYDSSYTYHKNSFRVNVFRQKDCCGVVMRTIATEIPTLESLRLPEIFRDLASKRRGLILVTGPTGSGKTTTLASMIEYMARVRNEHIITVEDPIEYIFSHGVGIVNQRQLGADTKSFASAIRGALREDPDIIVVGEMRDLETIAAAVTAAETGHLVISTLHTIGAAKTINRVIDAFPGAQQGQIRAQLAAVLQAVVSQQLLPNRSGNGRCLAMEVMVSNHAIQNLIQENKVSQIQNIIQLSSNEGMVTMDQSIISLYRKGLIDKQSVMKFCVDPVEMRKRLGS